VELDPDAVLETLYARRDLLSERDTPEHLVTALDQLIHEYREKRALALAGRHEAQPLRRRLQAVVRQPSEQ
jgi:hypothetical protein